MDNFNFESMGSQKLADLEKWTKLAAILMMVLSSVFGLASLAIVFYFKLYKMILFLIVPSILVILMGIRLFNMATSIKFNSSKNFFKHFDFFVKLQTLFIIVCLVGIGLLGYTAYSIGSILLNFF